MDTQPYAINICDHSLVFHCGYPHAEPAPNPDLSTRRPSPIKNTNITTILKVKMKAISSRSAYITCSHSLLQLFVPDTDAQIRAMMVGRLALYVCFMGYVAAGSGDVPVCSSKRHVTADVGGMALLSCHFSVGGSTSNLTVIWTKATGAAEDIVGQQQSKSGTVTNLTATLDTGRIQSNAANLSVARIRAEDAGEYRCWVVRSPPSLTDTYQCCTITLHVDHQWKGNTVQVVVAWSIYIIALSLCFLLLYNCRPQRSPPNKLYDV